MTSNLLLFPILIPFLFAVLLMFFRQSIIVQRTLSVVGLVLATITSFILLFRVQSEGIQTLDLGSWPAPFGITLVSDPFSALLVTTTLVLTLLVVIYSFNGLDEAREKFYYYPAVLFMITGINGAFTTGDIFNMFVFFEVFLMASYVLIGLGGEKTQLREAIKYMIVNVVSSALFVITVAYLYSVIGTLNMADISNKIALIDQPGIITVIAILFLIVFGIKGAIFPLYFWLPSAYAAPPAPILALFGALLTKVGVYAIMRTYTLFFVHDVGFTHEILLVLSIITIVVGSVGALAYFDVKQIIIYNVIIAVGVILFGAALMNEPGMEGAVFYLIHDMLIKGALFLLIGVLIYVTGTSNLRKMGGLMKTHAPLGWFYLIAAFGLAGIPPLSGFIGKYLIAEGGFEAGHIAATIVVLLSSLVVLLSVMRIFVYAFWGEQQPIPTTDRKTYRRMLIPAAAFVLLTVAYGVGAEWLEPFMSHASEVLLDPSMYVDAVLKE